MRQENTMRYITLLLIGLLAGCSSNKSKTETESISVINLSENVTTVPSLPLSEVVSKIDIVPLEVTDESILGEMSQLQVTDNDIWIKHYKEERIYRFSRSGKYLNKVGMIGQGPGEFVTLSKFFIDESRKEVYIVSASRGIFVYDFEGNFKRQPTQTIVETMFSSLNTQFLVYNNRYFIAQNTVIHKPVSKDSLWSFALVDSTYLKKKIFKNPAHIGREEQISKNCAQMDHMVNYWTESMTNIDTYNGQLTLKYPDTDTIYKYDITQEELIPQFSIYTAEEKGDYEYTHLWFRERNAFDYFSIKSYYPSKDYIYLVGSKGDKIDTYCYNKQDGSVKVQVRQGEITERKVPWFNIPFRRMECPFVLSNDLCGGDFTVDYRSYGKYWTDTLEPGNEENWIDINKVKASTVIDESKKKELIRALESINEDSNPILLIATLK